MLDMKVTPGETDASGTTATQAVTYPDGEQVAFGLNPGSSTTAPPPRPTATTATGNRFVVVRGRIRARFWRKLG